MKRRPDPNLAASLDKALVHAQALVDLFEPHRLGTSMKDRNRRLKLPSTNVGAIAPILHMAKKLSLIHI